MALDKIFDVRFDELYATLNLAATDVDVADFAVVRVFAQKLLGDAEPLGGLRRGQQRC